jgi:hypothetical protein
LQSAESENVFLQKEVDRLKQKMQSARTASPKKRKKQDEDVIPVPKSPKKSRSGPALTEAASDAVDLELDMNLDVACDDTSGECSKFE